jgi:hypothetical protein
MDDSGWRQECAPTRDRANFRRHRARHLPQRGQPFLRASPQDKGSSGGDDGHGIAAFRERRERLVSEGGWVRDREHGLQFKATITKTVPPTTAAGIVPWAARREVSEHYVAVL